MEDDYQDYSEDYALEWLESLDSPSGLEWEEVELDLD